MSTSEKTTSFPGDRKSFGRFYTTDLSAMMLAALAYPPDWMDWTDHDAVSALRICDPACGAGALLDATLRVMRKRTGREDIPPDNIVIGIDVDLGALEAAQKRIPGGQFALAPHGPQPDGSVKCGALELLVDGASASSGKKRKEEVVVCRRAPTESSSVLDAPLQLELKLE